MSKKRTRKQKVLAKHNFVFSANQDGQILASLEPVKGQFKSVIKKETSDNHLNKNADNLDKEVGLASVKKQLAKSLVFASLILALELVLYFVL